MTFESEAMPHSWMQYVIEGTIIALNSKTLLKRLSLLVGLSNQLSFLSLALSCYFGGVMLPGEPLAPG